MEKVSVNVTDYVPELLEAVNLAGVGIDAFPRVKAGLRHIALMYQKTWRGVAAGNMMLPGQPDMIRSRGPYSRSIQIDYTRPDFISVYTDFDAHRYIESGHGEIDLKEGLLHGPKARQGKRGPYNIVAFRHGIPKAKNNPMPFSIYSVMKQDTQKIDNMQKAGKSQRPGTSRATRASSVPAERGYVWGFRMDQMSQVGKRPDWKSGKYAGMVRMQGKSGKQTKYGTYLTFRVVSFRSDSRSWIVPPRRPFPIRQAVVDFCEPAARKVMEIAFNEDLSK